MDPLTKKTIEDLSEALHVTAQEKSRLEQVLRQIADAEKASAGNLRKLAAQALEEE